MDEDYINQPNYSQCTRDKGEINARINQESGEDAYSILDTTVSCIREMAREALSVSRGYSGKNRGDWQQNKDIKGNVETKKGAYAKLAKSKD